MSSNQNSHHTRLNPYPICHSQQMISSPFIPLKRLAVLCSFAGSLIGIPALAETAPSTTEVRTNLKQIPYGFTPEWSPDSKYILVNGETKAIIISVPSGKSYEIATGFADWTHGPHSLLYGAEITDKDPKLEEAGEDRGPYGIFVWFSPERQRELIGYSTCGISGHRVAPQRFKAWVFSESCCGVCSSFWRLVDVPEYWSTLPYVPPPDSGNGSIWVQIENAAGAGSSQEATGRGDYEAKDDLRYIPDPPDYFSLAKQISGNGSDWEKTDCNRPDFVGYLSPDAQWQACLDPKAPSVVVFSKAPLSARAATLPTDLRRLESLASAEYAKGRSSQALEIWRKIIIRSPFDALALNNIGFVKKETQFVVASLESNPSRAVAWLNLGDLLVSQGADAGVTQAYSRYLSLKPKAAQRSRLEKIISENRELAVEGGDIFEAPFPELGPDYSVVVKGKGRLMLLKGNKLIAKKRVVFQSTGCNAQGVVKVEKVKGVFGNGIVVYYDSASRGRNCDGGCGAGVDIGVSIISVDRKGISVLWDRFLLYCFTFYSYSLAYSVMSV
jgi:tetratricopeptide (TPR) repeat protein